MAKVNWRLTLGAGAVVVALSGGGLKGDVLEVPGEFSDIQSALDAAADADVILVAPGTYFEAIDFLGKAVVLRSSAGPEKTTISGMGQSGPVVRCASNEGPGTVLEGFEIRDGTLGELVQGFTYGGGMFNQGSQPTVRNCRFTANGGPDISGGGIGNHAASPLIVNCWFFENTADLGGGLLDSTGSAATIVSCRFFDNIAGIYGGGMCNESSGSIVVNSAFHGNDADGGEIDGFPIGWGGGIYMHGNSSTLELFNCTLSDNNANGGGDDIAVLKASVSVRNCIVAGGYYIPGTQWFQSHTIMGDPQFVAGTQQLAEGSPAIDSGLLTNIPSDIADLDGDGNTEEVLPLDLAGMARILDGDGDGTPEVDIGAYEFQVDLPCPADADGDGLVNVADLIVVIAFWGTADPAADIDDDGTVSVSDLTAVIVAWGPCPN